MWSEKGVVFLQHILHIPQSLENPPFEVIWRDISVKSDKFGYIHSVRTYPNIFLDSHTALSRTTSQLVIFNVYLSVCYTAYEVK